MKPEKKKDEQSQAARQRAEIIVLHG